MTPATAWRCCAAAGVVAFLCSWGFGRIPGLVACGPTGGLGPILAFEFVRSPADVAALFGVEPCRSTLVGAQKIGLVLDALGFIPAYTTFLIMATMASARIAGRWPPLALLTAMMIAFAGLLDEIEGVLLHGILSDMSGSQGLIDALWWPVHLKFALLGLGTLGIAILLLTQLRAARIVAALAITIGACTAGAGLIDGPSPVMMHGFTLSWVTILFAAFAASVRPSLFSGSAALPPAPAPPSA